MIRRTIRLPFHVTHFVAEHARPLAETFALGVLLYAFIALGLAL